MKGFLGITKTLLDDAVVGLWWFLLDIPKRPFEFFQKYKNRFPFRGGAMIPASDQDGFYAFENKDACDRLPWNQLSKRFSNQGISNAVTDEEID